MSVIKMECDAMDETAFQRSLKQSGKKPHVVDELIAHVKRFEAYLTQTCHKALDDANSEDIEDFAANAAPGQLKEALRGIALYCAFVGRTPLAASASALREKAIAKTRKVFALKDFRGLHPDHVAKLESVGIVNIEHMLNAGSTPAARQQLADALHIPPDAILELVKLSDLSRVGALKSVRARLYFEAGVDTPEKIAAWDSEALTVMLAEFVRNSGFAGIAPLPKEVRNTVAAARTLPKRVEY